MAVVKKRAETANAVIFVRKAMRIEPDIRPLHRLHEHEGVLVVDWKQEAEYFAFH